MVINAALTPIIDSISTPVFATAETTQKTSNEASSSCIIILVAVWSIGSGWHNGINSLEVFCVVSAFAKTGVEMEAIMGVNAALITIYDLSKIVNPHLTIDNVKLLIKEGGKSGLWKNPDGLPNFLKEIF